MKRGTYRTLLLLVVALSLLTSACFQLRFVKQQPKSIALGEVGTVVVELYPLESDANTTAYPFILIGWESGDMTLAPITSFDLKGNFGGPYAASGHSGLITVSRTPGNCSANGIDAADLPGSGWTWAAYRSNTMVDSASGTMGKKFLIKAKFTRIKATSGESGQFVIFSGTWNDGFISANGLAEEGEVYCTGMYYGAYGFNP